MLLTLLLALPRVSFSPSRSLSYFLIIEKTWRLSITIPTFRFYLGQKHPTWAHGRFEKSNFSQQTLSNYAFRYRLFPFFNVHKVYSFPVLVLGRRIHRAIHRYDEIVLRRILNKREHYFLREEKRDIYNGIRASSFSVNATSHARFTKSLPKCIEYKRNKNSRKELESSDPPCSSRERNIFQMREKQSYDPAEFFLLEIYFTYKSRRK